MYAPVWRHLQDVTLAALYDPDAENARSMRDLVGEGQVVDSVAALHDVGVDAVIVASPVWAHGEQCIDALDRGLHVFCEKPMARTVAECRSIIEAAERSDRILMLGFMKRFDPSFLKVRELIDAGTLGKIVEIRCDWSFYADFRGGSREEPQTWGGVFQDHGSHTVDLCRWWAVTSYGSAERSRSRTHAVESRTLAAPSCATPAVQPAFILCQGAGTAPPWSATSSSAPTLR